jgi:RecJ-like exonuclease
MIEEQKEIRCSVCDKTFEDFTDHYNCMNEETKDENYMSRETQEEILKENICRDCKGEGKVTFYGRKEDNSIDWDYCECPHGGRVEKEDIEALHDRAVENEIEKIKLEHN